MPEPIDRSALQQIQQLCAEIDALRQKLSELLSRYGIDADIAPIQKALSDAERAATEQAEETILALARVNFRNDQYSFIRAIDGDTITVEPPQALKEWMNDVRIRLYGVDAPESNDEHGHRYTQILERLCNINGGKLRVIWERERSRTQYGEFPRISFEREIGNVFVDLPGNNLLYVNAVLASLPHVTIERNSRPLLRGARYFRDIFNDLHSFPLHRHWSYSYWPLYFTGVNFSGPEWTKWLEWIIVSPQNAPRLAAPWVLPSKVALDSGSTMNVLDVFKQVFQAPMAERSCPGCRRVTLFIEADLPKLVEAEEMSVFDILIGIAHGLSRPQSQIQF